MGFCNGKLEPLLPVSGYFRPRCKCSNFRKLSSKAFLSFWKHSTFLMISFHFWCNMASLMLFFCPTFSWYFAQFQCAWHATNTSRRPQSNHAFPKPSVEMSILASEAIMFSCGHRLIIQTHQKPPDSAFAPGPPPSPRRIENYRKKIPKKDSENFYRIAVNPPWNYMILYNTLYHQLINIS